MELHVSLLLSKHDTVNFQLFISYASFSCVVNGCIQASVRDHLKQIPDVLIPNNNILHSQSVSGQTEGSIN